MSVSASKNSEHQKFRIPSSPHTMHFKGLGILIIFQAATSTLAIQLLDVRPSWSTDVSLFLRPSWDRILNPFSSLQSNTCPEGFDDGGCENCDSCFYLELHTSATGKTFSEGQVSVL